MLKKAAVAEAKAQEMDKKRSTRANAALNQMKTSELETKKDSELETKKDTESNGKEDGTSKGAKKDGCPKKEPKKMGPPRVACLTPKSFSVE